MCDNLARGVVCFDDVAVDAKGVRARRGLFFAEVGQDDNWRIFRAAIGADAFERFGAVHLGHLDVEKDDVWFECLDELNANLAVARHPHIKPVGLKLQPVHLADGRVVFDDGDFGHEISIANKRAVIQLVFYTKVCYSDK